MSEMYKSAGTLAIAALLTTAWGCGGSRNTYSPEHSAQYSGSKVEPSSSDETALLEKLDSLASGSKARVGGLTVVADRPYFAASGRTCRRVVISSGGRGGDRSRLACKDGEAWFFAPDVFAPGTAR